MNALFNCDKRKREKIDVPRDRKATFESKIIPKRTKDISEIEDKVLSIDLKYLMKQFLECFRRTFTMPTKPFQKFYPFVFVDCMYVTMELKSEDILFISMDDVSGLEE